MKKQFVIILIVLFGITCIANAQLVKSYGFKAAVTSAFQKFDYTYIPSSDIPWKRTTGINAGLYIEWFNLPVVSVVTQLEYRQVGVGTPFYTSDANGNILNLTILKSTVNYISMPLLLKAELPTNIANPYLLLGPRIDHLLSYSSDRDFWSPLYNQFKKTVYGASVGLGIETKHILPVTTLVEFRYDMDLVDSYHTEYLKVRNNSYDVYLGVGF